MLQREIELSKLEDELLKARKRLNDLVFEYRIGDRSAGEQVSQGTVSEALFRDKMGQLEAELVYLQRQLQLLKGMEPAPQVSQAVQAVQPEVQAIQPEERILQPEAQVLQRAAEALKADAGRKGQDVKNRWGQPALAQTVTEDGRSKSRDYEKLFGKNFMGIFASGLIFISLIIFATLIVPYLDDTLKLLGMYILSFGILGVGLLLYYKHMDNKFYIAVIGCGTGALYLSLLMSDLYFKVIGDIALYCLILVWAVLVKWLTGLKNLVFRIIGHVGIFIATFLGTVLCVNDGDEKKFFVLTVFYLLSACIFSDLGRAELRFLLPGKKDGADSQAQAEVCEGLCYEKRFLSHISRTLNGAVFLLGYWFMGPGSYKLAGIVLLVLSLLVEYYVSYRERCRHGLAFHVLGTADTFLLVGFVHVSELLAEEYIYIFMYAAAIALLFYVEIKNAGHGLFAQIGGMFLAFVGCWSHSWLSWYYLHLLLTIVPCLLYGKWKDKKVYLSGGIVLLAAGAFLSPPVTFRYKGLGGSGDYELLFTQRYIALCVVIAVIFAAFLYASYKLKDTDFKIVGYLLLLLSMNIAVKNMVFWLMKGYEGAFQNYDYGDELSLLIAFLVTAVIHLVMTWRQHLGNEKAVDIMMYAVNAWCMFIGCLYMGDYLYYHSIWWQLSTILVTVLLFLANSKRLLPRHKYMGYYIVFKYTVLVVCILNSFQAVNYVISICLLLFAIASIVMGFYRDNISFRLYGLVLSMISVIKLIMIDIHYDSTLENALSFFISGVLCFVISFIYHRIDMGFKTK